MANCIICTEFDDCPWRAEPNAMCSRYRQRKMTNGDRIRTMTDEELAELIGDNIDCSICKKDVFRTTTCPGSLTADGKDCYGCWLAWLRKVATDEQS